VTCSGEVGSGFHMGTSFGISEVLCKISRRFDLMYRDRKFVHWYVGAGVDPAEFSDAR
jgi:hypothetical protein